MNFMKNLVQRNLEQEREEEMPERGKACLPCGDSPSSGKTVVSVKLAEHLAKKKRNVILILADMVTPPLPYLCAPSDIEQERSLGSILAASHVTENLIKKNCMFYRKNDYLSMVGMLKGGECVHLSAHMKKSRRQNCSSLQHRSHRMSSWTAPAISHRISCRRSH